MATALPRVENPIPETIGLETVFAFAGAGGVFGTILGSIDRLRTRQRSREWWTRVGLQFGFFFGALLYIAAVIGQLVS